MQKNSWLFKDFFQRISAVALIGTFVGITASLASLAFVDLIYWIHHYLFEQTYDEFTLYGISGQTIMVVAIPTIGGLIVGLITRRISDQRPHALPDVIWAAQSTHGTMPVRSGLLTALAGIISMGSGASVGQYGPIAHLGATLGSIISKTGKNRRELGIIGIGCGVAAAIATIFNAPLAGLIFAHEVVLRHYSLRAFAPVTVAATMGYLVSEFFKRPPLLSISEEIAVIAPIEHIGFILIGIIGALIATLFMRTILFFGDFANRLHIGPFKPMVAGLALGLLALEVPHVIGIGLDVMNQTVQPGSFVPTELIIILVSKLVITAVCLGFGFAGGVFSPALLIGLLFGALVGIGSEYVLGEEHSHIAIYAVCGMAAIASPIIGAPLTVILIVLELTHNYNIAIAAMTSTVFANLVASPIFGRSLFDVQLQKRDIDLSLGRDTVILKGQSIYDYIDNNFVSCDRETTLDEAQRYLLENKHQTAYVVDYRATYEGTITLNQILRLKQSGLIGDEAIGPYVSDPVTVLTLNTSIWDSMNQLKNFAGDDIPVVVSNTDLHLKGIVHSTSLFTAYFETAHDIRHAENAV